jgi:hypothetical protein
MFVFSLVLYLLAIQQSYNWQRLDNSEWSCLEK